MSEQEIYKCPICDRYYDPLAVRRAVVLASAGKYNEAVAGRKGDDPVASAEAEALLVRAARAAFSLPAVDPATGAGWTDSQALDALGAFTRWLKAKKGSGQTGRNSTPCTGCP